MKRWYWGLLFIPMLMTGGVVISDFRSSFLVSGKPNLSTLGYLSEDRDDNWRSQIRTTALANGDTHIDIIGWGSQDPYTGLIDGVTPAWKERLKGLNDAGLAPVMWMRSDDSPDLDALPIREKIEYYENVIDNVDDQVSHYVVCLECDEYMSAPEVNVLIQYMRKKTDRPIGVHLTPGMRGKEAYVKNADVIYLQTGFGLTEAQFREEVEYALSLGLPVVVSEYHKDSTSAEAKHLGNVACSYTGVVGTGNGRGNTVCESLKEETKVKFVDRYDDELAVFMLALVTLSATYGLQMNLPVTASFNYVRDNSYEVMLAAPIDENKTVGATINDRGRVMAFINIAFDKMFSGGNKATVDTNERR
jgi:hypothetical protein